MIELGLARPFRRLLGTTCVVVSALLAGGVPAAACNYAGQNRTPGNGTDWLIGQETIDEVYRGINGGISVGPDTPNPTPAHTGTDHIGVMVAASQFSGKNTWAEIGWQMGFLQRLPSGVGIYSDSPTIFFEGIDNVADYRDVFGAADTVQRFEVSWGGAISGRWKYNAIYYRGGPYWIAGYSELDRELTQVDTQAEASDRPNQACIPLTSNSSTFHDMGVTWSLAVLTDVWHTWTSAYPQEWLLDTPTTSNNCGSSPLKPYRRWDYFPPDHYRIGVAGPCP